MIQEITKNTILDNGLQISPNLLLEHMSSGAWHAKLGEFAPRFSSKLIPSQYNNIFSATGIPVWKIARVLQLGANSVMERMLNEFGSDLIIRSGFLNNVSQETIAKGINEIGHMVGKSMDISVKGFEDNMFPLAKDIQKIANKASSINMVFGDTSWMHINLDIAKAASSAVREELPSVSSVDILTGITEKGISSLRGVL